MIINFIYWGWGEKIVDKDFVIDQLQDKRFISSLGAKGFFSQLFSSPNAILDSIHKSRHSPLGDGAKELIPISIVLH